MQIYALVQKLSGTFCSYSKPLISIGWISLAHALYLKLLLTLLLMSPNSSPTYQFIVPKTKRIFLCPKYLISYYSIVRVYMYLVLKSMSFILFSSQDNLVQSSAFNKNTQNSCTKVINECNETELIERLIFEERD